MTSLHGSRELTDQIIAVLEAASITVGDGEKPETIPANTGYIVVHALTGGVTDGSVINAYEDAVAPYQITSYGSSGLNQRKQCEWLADLARNTLLAGTYTLTGRKVIRISPAFLGGALRDDDVQPPVFYSPDRYDFRTVPT